MNKIQMIKLLKIRGITELSGTSIGAAIENSGGDPTDKEMVETNQMSMSYYIEKFSEQIALNEILKKENAELIKENEGLTVSDDFLRCLESDFKQWLCEQSGPITL